MAAAEYKTAEQFVGMGLGVAAQLAAIVVIPWTTVDQGARVGVVQ